MEAEKNEVVLISPSIPPHFHSPFHPLLYLANGVEHLIQDMTRDTKEMKQSACLQKVSQKGGEAGASQ